MPEIEIRNEHLKSVHTKLHAIGEAITEKPALLSPLLGKKPQRLTVDEFLDELDHAIKTVIHLDKMLQRLGENETRLPVRKHTRTLRAQHELVNETIVGRKKSPSSRTNHHAKNVHSVLLFLAKSYTTDKLSKDVADMFSHARMALTKFTHAWKEKYQRFNDTTDDNSAFKRLEITRVYLRFYRNVNRDFCNVSKLFGEIDKLCKDLDTHKSKFRIFSSIFSTLTPIHDELTRQYREHQEIYQTLFIEMDELDDIDKVAALINLDSKHKFYDLFASDFFLGFWHSDLYTNYMLRSIKVLENLIAVIAFHQENYGPHKPNEAIITRIQEHIKSLKDNIKDAGKLAPYKMELIKLRAVSKSDTIPLDQSNIYLLLTCQSYNECEFDPKEISRMQRHLASMSAEIDKLKQLTPA